MNDHLLRVNNCIKKLCDILHCPWCSSHKGTLLAGGGVGSLGGGGGAAASAFFISSCDLKINYFLNF